MVDSARNGKPLPDTLLEVGSLSVAYGGIQAVRSVCFEVRRGELLAMIGANGAGKSSCLRAITGLLPSSQGSVHYKGQLVQPANAHALPRNGLVMVPEGRGIFARMTIEENLLMGAYCREGVSKSEIAEDLNAQYQRFPRLKERASQLAGTLSGGEQQMLAMGRALMAHPELLLLDEPSMGLSPVMVETIFRVIAEVKAGGTTILLVEQNARLALQMADRALVLESGEITLEGSGQDLLASPAVRAAYLGE
jgi:branched-chain amino acid transport system ATP-binding protein